MTSVAIVEKISNGKIIVSSIRKGSCGDNCAMCGACNAEKIFTKVNSDISVNVGDTVRIKSNTGYVLLALCCLFILPVCTPIAAYILTSKFNSIVSYCFTAAVFLFSVALIFYLSKSKWFVNKITPEIIDIIKKK